MSHYDSLSSTAKDLVMLNFEFFGKKIFLMFALMFFFYYIFYYWKNKKESPYLFVGILRLFIYASGIAFLGTFPLMIFLLYPQVRLDVLLSWLLISYSVIGFLVSTIFSINILYYGVGTVAKFVGYAPDKTVDTVYNKFVKDFWSLVSGGRWGK